MGTGIGRTLMVWGLAALIGVACTRDPDSTVVGPELRASQTAAGPGLAIYGIGPLKRGVPDPCADSEYRQFDFWIGNWNIENPEGAAAGTSIITSELDGCAVMEDFIGPGGFAGRSLNMYDADAGMWFQRFVDGVVGNFRISGALVGSDMVMTGSQEIFHFPTGTFRQRDTEITWTPNPDGTVRQFIKNSFDGGPVQPGFDGLYIPADELDRADPAVFPFCQSVLEGARQLDFWLGSWQVSAQPGPDLGTSEVASDLNGCLIEENFVTRKGFQSRSFLFYDFVVDTWFRSYADVNGEHVQLSGGLVAGKMVMSGPDIAADGRAVELRVTIEPIGQGLVRQQWEISSDGGATWRTDLVLDYESLE